MLLTKEKSFYKSFFRLAFALMLQQAVIFSVNLADNIMIGNYSETALSGVAAVNQIQFVLQQIVNAISNGMIVLASQYWGQQKKEPVCKLVSIACWFASTTAAIFFIAASFIPYKIVGIFTRDDAIIEQGVKYLSIVKYSYLFFSITAVLLGSMRIVEKVKISLYVSVIALLINCSINFLLIKGRFGLPEMGVRGAATGTLIARIIECLVASYYVLYKDKLLQLKIKNLLKIDQIFINDYIRVSIPIIINGFLWGCSTALQTVILGHMSSRAIAAHSISSTIFLFLKVTSVGAASAAAVLTGKAVGSGIMDKVKEYTKTLQVLFVSIGFVLCLLMLAIRSPLLSLYVLSPETKNLASIFILIEASVLFTMSYQMCMNTGVICGGGDTRYVLIIDLVMIWGIVVPLSFVCAFYFHASPIIVLITLNCDQYLKCIPAAIYGNSYRWVRNLTRK